MVSMWFGPRRTCSSANGQRAILTKNWQIIDKLMIMSPVEKLEKRAPILEEDLDLEALPWNVKKFLRERRADSGKERRLFVQHINQSNQHKCQRDLIATVTWKKTPLMHVAIAAAMSALASARQTNARPAGSRHAHSATTLSARHLLPVKLIVTMIPLLCNVNVSK